MSENIKQAVESEVAGFVAQIGGCTDVEVLRKWHGFAGGQKNQKIKAVLLEAVSTRMFSLPRGGTAVRDLTPMLNLELVKGHATTFKNGNTGFDVSGEITVDGVKYRGEIRFAKSGMGLTKFVNGQRIRYNTDGKVLSQSKPSGNGKPSAASKGNTETPF